MIEIKLKDNQIGYDVIGEYVWRYWKHNGFSNTIVYMSLSFDGKEYYSTKQIACPTGNDVDFLYDWWEGEKFIKLFGIKSINNIDIEGGIYTKD